MIIELGQIGHGNLFFRFKVEVDRSKFDVCTVLGLVLDCNSDEARRSGLRRRQHETLQYSAWIREAASESGEPGSRSVGGPISRIHRRLVNGGHGSWLYASGTKRLVTRIGCVSLVFVRRYTRRSVNRLLVANWVTLRVSERLSPLDSIKAINCPP